LPGDGPIERYDERDIPFSRVRLRPGSAEYDAYYAMRPEKKVVDDGIRSLPGLLSHEGSLAEPLLFASPEGSFFLTEALRGAVDGPVAGRRLELGPVRAAGYLKALALYYGARSVGIAELRPYHVYSHIGREFGRYGQPIPFEAGCAIAFTVEMDLRMARAAPRAPAVMESGRQYVEAARIAVQLAAAVRAMGYPARAHIDGSYRVIAPLVARDAGLGEIGRMGLLMTPRLGPRVRLGVVTTALDLAPDGPTRDATVIDFCERCRKCAVNCPAQAIPDGERTGTGGEARWRIDGDACFRYWSVVGTDCARCMAVCPYSHADNLFHNAVRWGVRRSALFRRAAVRLDDVFYGRRPVSAEPPAWIRVAGGRLEKSPPVPPPKSSSMVRKGPF
jgi:reductive dehalogenase